MSEQFNKIREIALAKIFADFDSKLEGTIESFNESDIRDDDIEIGVSLFQRDFQLNSRFNRMKIVLSNSFEIFIVI